MKERIIGFTSGCLYKTHNPLSPETIDIFRKSGCNAIELHFHEVEDIEDFIKLKKEDLTGFKFVSLHAPIYRGAHQERAYEKCLEAIAEKQNELHFQTNVLHPDMFDNFDLLNKFDLPYLVENMDDRKGSCQGAGDLKRVFERLEANFLLDVNHVYTNDKSMKLTGELLEEFGDKLSEIHLSGFDNFHDPLYKTKQDFFVDVIKDRNVPIIIESIFESPEEIAWELEYIKNLLTE